MTDQSTADQNELDNMVDLSAVLEQDSSGSAAREFIATFEADAAPLEAALRGALSPDEYKSTSAMAQALRAAQGVIRTVWTGFHPGKDLAC
jgi:hypothetical protein